MDISATGCCPRRDVRAGLVRVDRRRPAHAGARGPRAGVERRHTRRGGGARRQRRRPSTTLRPLRGSCRHRATPASSWACRPVRATSSGRWPSRWRCDGWAWACSTSVRTSPSPAGCTSSGSTGTRRGHRRRAGDGSGHGARGRRSPACARAMPRSWRSVDAASRWDGAREAGIVVLPDRIDRGCAGWQPGSPAGRSRPGTDKGAANMSRSSRPLAIRGPEAHRPRVVGRMVGATGSPVVGLPRRASRRARSSWTSARVR